MARATHIAEHRLSGTPSYLGTVSATAPDAKSNASTAVPFAATSPYLRERILLLQPSVDSYVGFGTVSDYAVTSATGLWLLAHERVVVSVESTFGWVSYLPGSGSGSLKVWELL